MMLLVDCYLPVFRFVTDFLLHPEQYSDYEEFRHASLSVIDRAAREAEKNHDANDCDNAFCAIVIWFDECVLCSSLSWVKQWRGALLQTQFFQTSIGGEVFFERLDALEDNKPVRMIYLTCLLLGFHGKYTGMHHDQLIQRIEDERKWLPEEWQAWPNNAQLSKSTERNERNKKQASIQFLRSGILLSCAVAGSYMLLFVGLLTFLF